ncbi:hypothetical protein ACI0ZQ_001262 [Cronobacter dublinensis]|uniref:hypothetical protein n=1 Tax=Cronobacter dublinensis TaxID=413497 RepID=UPI0027381D7A|nr:hypothetical protein [Cronobacter dublinensis]ELQ6124281.1 hypothetical protein [Cronobacter dublinensis]
MSQEITELSIAPGLKFAAGAVPIRLIAKGELHQKVFMNKGMANFVSIFIARKLTLLSGRTARAVILKENASQRGNI